MCGRFYVSCTVFLFWHLTKRVHDAPFSIFTYLSHKKARAAFFSCHGCGIAPAYGRDSLRVDTMQGMRYGGLLVRRGCMPTVTRGTR